MKQKAFIALALLSAVALGSYFVFFKKKSSASSTGTAGRTPQSPSQQFPTTAPKEIPITEPVPPKLMSGGVPGTIAFIRGGVKYIYNDEGIPRPTRQGR